MPAPVYLSHPASLEHETGAHPERAARIAAIERELEGRGWLGLRRIGSEPAAIESLTAVHDRAYIRSIQSQCEQGGASLDPDTVVSPGSWLAALHGAGGAVGLVDLLLDGRAPSGFSAHRPPGHHAERARAMGFCLFNNVAVAAAHALAAHGLQRVLVLDWDVHHGNGIEHIFQSSAAVLYCSIHEYPLYPGTGAASDIGAGPGSGYTLNLPVRGGSGDECFVSLVQHVIAPVARSYRPQLVLIAAGYDAHADDPLASCRVTESGYAAISASMRLLCEELAIPCGVVLEGGYALGALARSVAATLEVFAAATAPAESDVAVHPVSRAARARLSERWGLTY
jgi:acetoin utilization deacetylase AcuC-like enzyme